MIYMRECDKAIHLHYTNKNIDTMPLNGRPINPIELHLHLCLQDQRSSMIWQETPDALYR
jgi:hypothetical protein